MSHVRGEPFHPQTQGKIGRWRQTFWQRGPTIKARTTAKLESALRVVAASMSEHCYHNAGSHSGTSAFRPLPAWQMRDRVTPMRWLPRGGANRTLLMVSVLVLLSATATPKDRAAIDRQTQRLNRAFETKHFAAWNRIISDSFQIDGKGVGKAAFIAGGQAEAAHALPPVRANVRNVSFRKLAHNEIGTEARELTCYDFVTRKRLRHRLCYRQHFMATWQQQDDTWKLAAMHELPGQDFRIDGKRVSRDRARAALKE